MTTSAVNENRRPPLTTLATRLISTTRSLSSLVSWTSTAINVHPLHGAWDLAAKSKPGKDAGSVRSRRLRARPRTQPGAALPRARDRGTCGGWTCSKLQASFAGGVRQRLHPAVVEVAAPVEDDLLDAVLPGGRREQLADLGRLLRLVARERLRQVEPRGGRDGAAGVVVDELREDAAVRAEDDETRPLRAAADLAAHAAVAAQTRLAHGQARHASRPSSERTRP